jgi:hypothetical protein
MDKIQSFNRKKYTSIFIVMLGIIFLISAAYSAGTESYFNYEITKVTVPNNPNPKPGDNVQVRVFLNFDAHNAYYVWPVGASITLDYWIDGVKQQSRQIRQFSTEYHLEEKFSIRMSDKDFVDITFEVNAAQDKLIQMEERKNRNNKVTVNTEKTYQDNRRTIRIYINDTKAPEYTATPTLNNHPLGLTGYLAYEAALNPNEKVQTEQTGKISDDFSFENRRTAEKYQGQTPLERMIAALFTAIAQGIYDILGIVDPLVLIFDYEPIYDLGGNHQSRSELYLGIYNEWEMSAVVSLYQNFEVYLPLWFLIAIILTGIMLIIAGFGGDQRLTLKQYLAGIGIGMAMLAFGPTLIDMVFDIVYAGVDIIKDLIERTAYERDIQIPQSLLGVLLAGFMAGGLIIENAADFARAVTGVTGLMYAIVIFLVFIGAGVLNWQYIVRKITLAVLIFMFPIVAGLAVFPNTRGVLKLWLSEFLANAFLPVAHAIVYGFLIIISMSPGKAFSPLELIIYTVGLNGTISLVRRMFGAHESPGALGGIGAILGLSSIIGLSRVALGTKAGFATAASGLKGANTAVQAGSQMAQAGTSAQTAVNSAQGLKNVIQSGSELTPSQAGIMAAQQQGILTPQQQLELDTIHRDLNPIKQTPVNPSWKSKIARVGGAVAIGSFGALATGLTTGKASPGMALGGFAGYHGSGKVIDSARNIRQAIKDPASMGIYDSGQLFDAQSASVIGRRLAGAPGAAIGSVVSKVASATQPQSAEVQNMAESLRSQIDTNYAYYQQEFINAEQQLQVAQHDMQQLELQYSAKEKSANSEYMEEHEQATFNLGEAKRNYQIKQLQLREAELMKQKEHEYVGTLIKMSNLQRNLHSNGGFGGQKWRF